eukprot:TRINITY_DN4205_c0_g2_i1.p1 TRINITY_DN4205_c0_g2~~TRINITY_DN4205_c0_g2_i1.p1  ORF type:complete len:756 (-),score=125.96 TRINITY_DN4205_c0_g2_i1:80-2347(-)
MRVRHLQSFLAENGLVQRGTVDTLRKMRIGVDAVFWLRSIQALKDPFADALGGIPPGIFGFVEKELDMFRKCVIQPLFVFQGVAPGPQHSSMFVSRMDQQMEAAWSYLAQGQKSEAQKCFAISTSRINGDFVYFIFHHLRNKGYECLQAPYFAGAQLAHFAEQGVVQAVFGPPGLLLYGVQSVIIHMDIPRNKFEWVDLDGVLRKLEITRDQFVDACMLAGTEYCLTYPYFNLNNFQQPQAPGRFNFDQVISIAKQAPLINWMQTYPTEEMKADHVDGYCTCKVLVHNSPVLHLPDYTIRPLGGNADTQQPVVPFDFNLIMGEKLPTVLYFLLCKGFVSHKMPQALGKGEWIDKSQPLVDTTEFRSLIQDLTEYRQNALGLIAQHLHKSFQEKRIVLKGYWEPHVVRQSSPGHEDKLPPDARIIKPTLPTGLKWNINGKLLEEEMKRQGVDQIDFRFCLQWHAYQSEIEGPLIPSQGGYGPPYPACSNDTNSLAALVHLMVLENLELIADDGGMTVLGNELKDTPRHLQEPTLVALEMMKFGVLTSEPFESAQPDRPFPEQVNYPRAPAPQRVKAVLLLSRVMSLVPMKLKSDMWNADVDFDLAAFHSLVRVLKRTLRQLVEASLASVLMSDLDRVSLLPRGFMCTQPRKDDHLQTPAILPTFMLPRACLGILVRHFLEYRGDPANFAQELSSKFPCCVQPLDDLRLAFKFWENLRRCVDAIAEPLDCTELRDEMHYATQEVLIPQQKMLRIFTS